MKLPSGVTVEGLTLRLEQEEDSCGRADVDGQVLEVDFQDAGGGHYYVLKTDRWAVDSSDASLFNWLAEVCNKLDKNEVFQS